MPSSAEARVLFRLIQSSDVDNGMYISHVSLQGIRISLTTETLKEDLQTLNVY